MYYVFIKRNLLLEKDIN